MIVAMFHLRQNGVSTGVILFALFLPALAAPTMFAQGRAQAAQPAAQTPAAVTVPATPTPAATAGRGGRGVIAGPGPAVGGDIDETPVVTHHSITIGGKAIGYTATAAEMPLKNTSGETEAHMFYVAYTLDGVDQKARRPLTFCFNGGPGSASFWVHMGGMGPRSPKLLPNGAMPPPPYELKDNADTWLDQTDLVFIDAVGTGYSRARTIEVARRMNGVAGDIQSFGEFIRMYIVRNGRQLSPLFIAGESYGTFRAAGLAGYLENEGIAFNGITLIGTVLNLGTLSTANGDINYILALPTCAADAWYHKKAAPDLLRKDLKSFLKEVESFAQGEYATALGKGDDLSAADRKAVIDKLARYTGLDARYIDESNLRWDTSHFTRELLRDKLETIGRYDGRLTGPSSPNTGETSEYDPSETLITPPFVAAFTNYVREELGFKTDLYYYPSGGIQPWDYGLTEGYADTASMLRNALVRNPYLKVMIVAGYFDMATPYFAVEYTFNHMGLSPDMHARMTWNFYQAGHMLYIDGDQHAKLKKDVAAFMAGALPKPDAQ